MLWFHYANGAGKNSYGEIACINLHKIMYFLAEF